MPQAVDTIESHTHNRQQQHRHEPTVAIAGGSESAADAGNRDTEHHEIEESHDHVDFEDHVVRVETQKPFYRCLQNAE